MSELVILSNPDFDAFARYVTTDCAFTTWESHMRRTFRLLGFPADFNIMPPAPTVGVAAGIMPRTWHRLAIANGSYAPVLEALTGKPTSNPVIDVEGLSEMLEHPMAPVFLHGVRKFTGEQLGILNMLASPHMDALVGVVGVDALLGFLPARPLISRKGEAFLGREIMEHGCAHVVPVKPSQVFDSALGKVLHEALTLAEETLADAQGVPLETTRACWFLTHDSALWSDVDIPSIAPGDDTKASKGEIVVTESPAFEDVLLF